MALMNFYTALSLIPFIFTSSRLQGFPFCKIGTALLLAYLHKGCGLNFLSHYETSFGEYNHERAAPRALVFLFLCGNWQFVLETSILVNPVTTKSQPILNLVKY